MLHTHVVFRLIEQEPHVVIVVDHGNRGIEGICDEME